MQSEKKGKKKKLAQELEAVTAVNPGAATETAVAVQVNLPT